MALNSSLRWGQESYQQSMIKKGKQEYLLEFYTDNRQYLSYRLDEEKYKLFLLILVWLMLFDSRVLGVSIFSSTIKCNYT